MAKFDCYTTSFGLLLQVQSEMLDGLDSVVVVPLISIETAPLPASRLNPVFSVNDKEYAMQTHLIGAVPKALLKTPAGNLGNKFDEITNALDMLFHGF